jgi:TolB-like protein
MLSLSRASATLNSSRWQPVSERLDSWKDIAAYLGREVRTVQRWESERALPVHRLPGGDKPRVYALKPELDAWLGARGAEPVETPSIAVLPFVNLSGDKENEYFSDGLADEILNALTRVPRLRVTARTSSFAFRGREQDVREIGARLGASALLEGSVRREAGRVRVSAQLVSSKDGYHLWSENYDRELDGIFAVQDDIAAAVARELKARLGPRTLVERPTADLEAYNQWLKGRYVGGRWTPEAVAEARECYAAALARDPQFALPYVALADLLFEASWFGLAQPVEACREAKEAVLKALALDDTLGEAHSILGALRGVAEYDWANAEKAFERALELCPGSVAVRHRYAWYFLTPKLRIAEALTELRQAVGQDPFSPLLHSVLGFVLIAAREYERAEAECRVAVDLAPGLWWPQFFLSCALIPQGKAEEGIARVRLACDRIGGGPLAIAAMCLTYGLLGCTDEAARMLAQLEETGRTTPVPALALAWAYLGLGDERVFEWLGKAIDERHPAVIHMPWEPMYDGIRGDPRFRALLARMGLD